MFSFASKMLNTIMGTEDGQPPGPGQPSPMGMMSHQQQQQQPPLRPMSGFPQVRPNPQVGGPRPYGGPPTFSGPRPNPGLVRGGPPNFGGPPRPMGGPGTPHRFNGPQPATSPGMPRAMHPGGPQPGIRPGPPGVTMTMRPRGPGPGPFPQKTQPQLPGAAGSLTTGASGATGVPVPDVDLSHLSAEERAMIENVMAKAQQLEQEAPPAPVGVLPGALPGQPGTLRMMRPEDQLQQPGGDYGGRQCPLCRQRDVSGRDGHPGQECSECRTLVCYRCGGMATHPETKRPEWTCGNCIKRRRMGSAPNVAVTPGHQNLGPRPQLGPYSQQQSPNVDWDGGRRASIGSGIQGPGGPQQRWESEREFDNLDESKEAVGTWESDTGQTRRYSAEMTLTSQGEQTEQSEELFLNPSSKSPVDLDDEPSPLTDLPPDHSLSMSTPVTASASKAKPSSSFVKMHSRSISIDMAETDDEGKSSSSLNNGFGMYSPVEHEGLPADTTYSSTHRISIPSLSKPDSNTDALMEELSKLQSAVESYSLKRRERQKREVETDLPDSYAARLSPSPISRSRSPSPSPSPKDSPGKSGESMSPMHSLSPVYHLSPQGGRGDSPESPESEYPAPRKAIVMKEHDLDDYKSSTDEDTDSDSEEERKTGVGGSEVVAYYDHSPGEVYTIPEEEDEGGSPTGGDLVTSLNRPGIQGSMGENGSPRRRLVGQECLPGMSPADMRHSIRPQLRSQRSLDNRLPSSSNQQQAMDLMNQQALDQQGNISYPNNNLNTQAPSQVTGAMDNQIMLNQSTINASNSMSGPITAPQSIGIPGTSAASILHPQSQQQTMLSSSVGSDMQSLEMNVAGVVQRPSVQSAQQQALSQSGVGLGGGVGSEWNSNLHMSSLQCPTSGMTSVSPTDPSLVISQNQPYQQQQSTHAINPSVVQNQSQLQSQQSASMHPSQQQQLQSQIHQQQQLQQQQLQQQQQILQQQQQQHLQLQQQSQQIGAQQAQLLQQQQLQQLPQSQQQQLSPMNPTGGQLGQQEGSLHSLQQQQQWSHSQQPSHSQSQLYDQSGRPLSSSSQYAQLQPALGSLQSQQQQHMGMSPQHYQQQTSGQMNLMHTQQQQQQHPQSTQGPQAQHSQQLQGIGMGGQHPQGSSSHLNVSTSQAGPGAKSISGLLADFSRALGLGSTSPRPSPSEDKSEPFPIPSSAAGSGGMSIQGLPLSPYDNYSHPHQHPQQQMQHQQGALQQHLQPSYQGYQTSQQQQQQHHVQQSAFASIQDSSQAFLQRQQHQSMVSQQSQQYSHAAAMQQSQASQQPVMTQGGNVMTQQQAASLGVGVVGALSPAQAHMYQQQMALQHQAQHMKKTSRRAHLSSSTVGEMRRDGGPSTVIIGGQGLAVTPSGMAIGALTPAVVTSLGTFIGGGPALIGTSLLSQPLAVTPLGTPIGTPVGTPRSGRDPGGCDSSDTMSETDSQKSLRMRRKLPCLPPDQEAAPLPSTKKRDRQRAQETFRSLSPMRMSSLDNTIPGRSYGMSSLSLSRPSASESNLRKLCMGPDLRPDPIPRPGSALGLLQASSVVSSMGAKSDTVYPLSGNLFSTSSTFPGMGLRTTTSGFTASSDLTTTTSVLSGLYPSYKTSDTWSSNMAELAACLPPDLRHLLNKSEHGDISGGVSGLSGLTSSLGETSLNVGSHLPTYMRTLREQLQEERRQLLSEERRRLEALRERDRELGARLDAVTSRAASDSMRSRADLSRNVGISRSAGASPLLSRKLKGHRRQLSDPKLSLPFSPIQEDGDSELQDFERSSTGILRTPYKSYEYESLEDTALLRPPPGEWDPSQSYLAPSWGSASVLRETAISSMGGLLDDDEMRAGVSSRFLRRSSEGEAWPPSGISRSLSSSRDKRHQLRKHRKSRSWHPSPYVSEEEDDEEEDNLSREEKKARIKAEIARRRQQIQEKAGLHNELLRISRYGGDMQDRHSVLKSVDQLVREQYGRFDPPYQHYGRPVSSLYTTNPRMNRGLISPSASEEDRSIERIASTFRSDDYTNMLYERIGEISPLATDTESMGSELGMTPAAMPLLPDMPTRSRRLLEDLGSAPIGMTEGGRSSSSTGTNMKGRLPKVGLLESPGTNSSQGDGYLDDYRSVGVGGCPVEKIVKSNKVTVCNIGPQPSNVQTKKSQASNVQMSKKYSFPIKRLLLHRDPKDKSVGGMGLGMKIVGGKEIPDSNGRIAAYVAKIYSGGVTDTLGDVQEGDIVLEWNGTSLDNKTFEEVQSIVGSSDGEIEVVLRSDFDILTGKPRPRDNRHGEHQSLRQRRHSNCPQQGEVSGSGAGGCRIPHENYKCEVRLSDQDRDYQDSRPSHGPDRDCGVSRKERFLPNLAKSPSSSTENTSVATSSIHQSVITDERSLRTAAFVQSGNYGLSNDAHRPSVPRTPKDPSNLSMDTGSDHLLSSNNSSSVYSPLMTSQRSGHRTSGKRSSSNGHVQLQICHDPKANILYVTVLKAKLPKQQNDDGTDHVQVDPYIVVYLLPERILENQRRTRHVPMCSSPQWNQTMVYPGVALADLKTKLLEVSAWNYNPTGDDDFLGKVTLDLSEEGILDEQPHSYGLKRDEKPSRRRSGQSVSKVSSGGGRHGRLLSDGNAGKCSVVDKRTLGRMSIFSPTSIPAQNAMPTDCHAALCIIL